MSNFDLSVIYTREKYNILENNKCLEFQTPYLGIPFGVEKYNGKHIINLQFDGKDKNNKIYESFTELQRIESWLRNIVKDEKWVFYEDFKDKEYIPSIKPRGKWDPIIRCHLKGGKKGITAELNSPIPISFYDLANNKAKATIALDSIWTTNDTYGLLFIVTKLEL